MSELSTNSLCTVLTALLVFPAVAGCGSDGTSPPRTSDGGADAGTDSGTADAGATDAGMLDAGPMDAGMADAGLLNGSACTVDDECASTVCQVFPFLGGQCGECKGDVDCVSGGCTFHDPSGMTGSTCNTGQAGEGCESDAACDGLKCGGIIDLLGLIEVNTCGACATDADCMNPAASNCIAVVDLDTFSGQRFCLGGGSLANGEVCDREGNGDTHCASGHCSDADVSGLADIGICSECKNGTNAGCAMGFTCTYGAYDLLGDGSVTPSTCVP